MIEAARPKTVCLIVATPMAVVSLGWDGVDLDFRLPIKSPYPLFQMIMRHIFLAGHGGCQTKFTLCQRQQREFGKISLGPLSSKTPLRQSDQGPAFTSPFEKGGARGIYRSW
jgi:hypothetical protein